MTTEDDRYRQSSQYRLWSFSPSSLHELRSKTNALAAEQIAPRLTAEPKPPALTVPEEKELVKFFTYQLLAAADHCDLSPSCRATAAIFFRRFYSTNSVMTYPPTELIKTCLFFGCKAEGNFISLHRLADKFPNTTGEQILAGEFLLCQGIRFAFDVRHGFRPLEGAVMELVRRFPEEEARIREARTFGREVLMWSALMTDVYFYYTPSQVMLAALMMVDEGLAERLLPPAAGASEEKDVARAEGLHSDMRDKIMATIRECRDMLAEEPPKRRSQYWESESVQATKPLRKKLQKCRDPDRADLVALQKARRQYAQQDQEKNEKVKQEKNGDGDVFGGALGEPEAKRIKLEAKDDMFGGAL